MRPEIRYRGLCLVAFALLFCASVAAAPSEILSADITPLTRPRTDAPVPARVHFAYDGTALLEGYLFATFRESGQIIGRYRMFDVALVRGDHFYQVILPPMKANVSAGTPQVDIDLVFRTRDDDIELLPDTMIVSPWMGRSSVVAACTPWHDPTKRLTELLTAFNWELRMPSELKGGAGIGTYIAHMSGENLPKDPMELCAYDIVLLVSDAFAALKPQQLDALLRWVYAGGAVCVIPESAALPRTHVAFLNALAGEGAPFVADDKGVLLAPEGVDKPIRTFRPEMGRAAVVTKRTFEEGYGQSLEWNRMVAFLWRVRAEHVETFAARKPINALVSQPSINTHLGGVHQSYGAGHIPSPAIAMLSQQMMPKSVRLVPFGLVAVLLGGFLLLIGPVDYFALGALKMRPLTWVLFPASCIAITVLAVWAANAYMGRDDHRVGCTVIDIGPGGRVLRSTRLEQLYVGQNRQVVTGVKGAVFTGIDRSAYQGWRYRGHESPADDTFFYSGHIPASYEVVQSVAQWSPQMNRMGTFVEQTAKTPVDFDSITYADTLNLVKAGGKLRVRNGFKGSLFLVRGDRAQQVRGWSRHEALAQRNVNYNLYNQPRYNGMGVQLPQPGPLPRSQASFILEICSRVPVGAFCVVSQVSPNFGPNIEDLALLDGPKDSASVVLAVEREGSNVTIYRRLYTGGTR